MKHGLKVCWFREHDIEEKVYWSLFWTIELDHAYAVKKKQQKKENRKKNGLKVDLSGFNDILGSIEIKPKSELASEATHSKKLAEQPKQPAIPSNKIKAKKAKKNAE